MAGWTARSARRPAGSRGWDPGPWSPSWARDSSCWFRAWGLGLAAFGATGHAALLSASVGGIGGRFPELLALIGISALLYGIGPRWQGLAWVMFGYGVIIRFFGQSLPDAVQQLSIFQHIPRMPAEEFSVAPVVYLSAGGVALVGAALFAFRRRDL